MAPIIIIIIIIPNHLNTHAILGVFGTPQLNSFLPSSTSFPPSNDLATELDLRTPLVSGPSVALAPEANAGGADRSWRTERPVAEFGLLVFHGSQANPDIMVSCIMMYLSHRVRIMGLMRYDVY